MPRALRLSEDFVTFAPPLLLRLPCHELADRNAASLLRAIACGLHSCTKCTGKQHGLTQAGSAFVHVADNTTVTRAVVTTRAPLRLCGSLQAGLQYPLRVGSTSSGADH